MRLIISDLDGTLYPKKGENIASQLQKNYSAVKKWVNNGNKFAVATARGIHHCAVLEKELGFNINYIGCNGASVIFDSGETLIKELPCKVFIDLCKFVECNNIDASVTTGLNNKWIWSRLNGYPKGVPEYDFIWDSVELANLNEINPNDGIQRIQIFTPPENRDKLKKQLIQLNIPGIITTSDHDMIDVGPLNSSKGISIIELCQKFQINPEDIIVIGDSENDIPMFEISKHSYCINTAEESVIKRATKCVSSVEEAINIELGL